MTAENKPVLNCLVCQDPISLIEVQADVPASEPPKEASIEREVWVKVEENGSYKVTDKEGDGAILVRYRLCLSCEEDRLTFDLKVVHEKLLAAGYKPLA